MWGRCSGNTKRTDKLTELDFSSAMITSFPKIPKRDLKNILYVNFENNHFVEIPKVFISN